MCNGVTSASCVKPQLWIIGQSVKNTATHLEKTFLLLFIRLELYTIPSKSHTEIERCELIYVTQIRGQRNGIFSKNRPSGPIHSVSRNIRMFVSLLVCLFVTLSHSV